MGRTLALGRASESAGPKSPNGKEIATMAT
jgi:hypothetical protein